ncbi:MAG: diguanylate cyclase, partial [Lachnospiraceae bacterium]|nr:diguanylate cyclase [Lachnospiraceae bacterium]
MDKDQMNHIINESVITKEYDKDRRIRPKHTASYITLIYIVIGSLWILLSDRILSALVQNEEIYRQIQLFKGWFYVFATGVIFYLIIYRAFLLYRKTMDSLVSSYEELNAIYEEMVAMNEELDRQRTELGVSEERYRLVTEGVTDGIWDWDIVNDVYYVSDKWKQDFGYESQEIGSTIFAWEQLYYPGDWERCRNELEQYFERKTGVYEAIYRRRNKANEYRWILSRGKGVWDQEEHPVRMAGSHTDITEKKEMEDKLEKLAYFDSLSLLPNRAFFEQEVSQKLSMKQKVCIVNVDVDDMKHINDLYGQGTGDVYLQYISKVMSDVFSCPDMVAHISGDQFAILHVMEEEDDFHSKLDLLMLNIRRPWKTNGDILHVSASMGIAVYPEHGTDYSTLMQNAEIAMFYKKENKKDGYVFFEKKMYEDAMKLSQMNAQLKRAIAAKEFLLYYQPQYDLKSGKLSGLEALIRWNHPKDGFIPPMEFIPIAEKAGSIIPITLWVLQTGIETKRKWEMDGLLSVK